MNPQLLEDDKNIFEKNRCINAILIVLLYIAANEPCFKKLLRTSRCIFR
jgi:hypothetical protein